MSKIMPLEVLSGIKDARSSQSIDELFDVVSKAYPYDPTDLPGKIDEGNIVTVEKLRDDLIVESTNQEKDLIKRNFPREKNGFLVVSKVIER